MKGEMTMKNVYGLSFVVAAVAAALVAQPAHAGGWQLTQTVTCNETTGSWGAGPYVNSSSSTEYDFGYVFDNSSPESGGCTYSGSIQWTGGGTQPSSVTLSETAEAEACGLYTDSAIQTASDGLGDASTTWTDNNPYDTTLTESDGSHQTTVPMSNGEIYDFTRTLTCSSKGAAINECYVTYGVSL